MCRRSRDNRRPDGSGIYDPPLFARMQCAAQGGAGWVSPPLVPLRSGDRTAPETRQKGSRLAPSGLAAAGGKLAVSFLTIAFTPAHGSGVQKVDPSETADMVRNTCCRRAPF